MPLEKFLSPGKVLLGFSLLCWSCVSYPYETACLSGGIGPKKLRVTVPAERRLAFIEFLQSDKRTLALGARYVGGVDSSRRLTIAFLDTPDPKRESRVDIWAENIKPSLVFDFHFQTCNTTRSLRPYLDATKRSIAQFGKVTMVELPAK